MSNLLVRLRLAVEFMRGSTRSTLQQEGGPNTLFIADPNTTLSSSFFGTCFFFREATD
jgi:hypothetical protein